MRTVSAQSGGSNAPGPIRAAMRRQEGTDLVGPGRESVGEDDHDLRAVGHRERGGYADAHVRATTAIEGDLLRRRHPGHGLHIASHASTMTLSPRTPTSRRTPATSAGATPSSGSPMEPEVSMITATQGSGRRRLGRTTPPSAGVRRERRR